MDFGHYSQRAAELVNADLSTQQGLRDHLSARPWLLDRLAVGDLKKLQAVQADLSAWWTPRPGETVLRWCAG